MKKFAHYYTDSKEKYYKHKFYLYKDQNGYLFSEGFFHTKTKEEDLPDYYLKIWLYPFYKYLSLKNIKDIYYRPCFLTNHWRKDDLLYISYQDKIVLDENGYASNYDTIIYGHPIDIFINALEKQNYANKQIKEIRKLLTKKDKWYQYWQDHNWDGNYSFTSKEVWQEILKG